MSMGRQAAEPGQASRGRQGGWPPGGHRTGTWPDTRGLEAAETGTSESSAQKYLSYSQHCRKEELHAR